MTLNGGSEISNIPSKETEIIELSESIESKTGQGAWSRIVHSLMFQLKNSVHDIDDRLWDPPVSGFFPAKPNQRQ